MPDSLREIVEHYQQIDEEERLVQGQGLLERIRTQEIISRYLPAPPAKVLDVGGGPGTYALWLTRREYQVDLIDPVDAHIRRAVDRLEDEGLEGSARLGDARDLDAEDQSYDAVLLLGPMYHLTESKRSSAGPSGSTACAAPGPGYAFVAAISRFASLMDGFSRGFIRDPAFVRIMEQDLADGQHRNAGNRDYFTTAYFHSPDELSGEIDAARLSLEALLGVEGPFWCMAGFHDFWEDPASRDLLLKMLRRVESEPTLLGASAHLFAVVQRPD